MGFIKRVFHKLFVDDEHSHQNETEIPPPPAFEPPLNSSEDKVESSATQPQLIAPGKEVQDESPIAAPETRPSSDLHEPSPLEKSASELLAESMTPQPASVRRDITIEKPQTPITVEEAPIEQNDERNTISRMLDAAPKEDSEWSLPPPFYLKDGSVLEGPSDLAVAAEDMEEHVFEHHVTDEKNDFAHWIEDAHGKPVLAKHVRFAKNPKELAVILRPYHPEQVSLEKAEIVFDDDGEAVEAAENEPDPHAEEPVVQTEAPVDDDALNAEIEVLRDEVSRLQQALSEEISGTFSHIADDEQHEKQHAARVIERIEDGLARARALLRNGHVDESRIAYGVLREQFYSVEDMPADKKRALHGELKELYMDIELARLQP